LKMMKRWIAEQKARCGIPAINGVNNKDNLE
jgi:hypothetical protein